MMSKIKYIFQTHPLRQFVTDYLAQKNLRDRMILLGLGILVILALGYYVIIAPLNLAYTQAKETKLNQQQLYHWMHKAAHLAEIRHAQGQDTNSQAILPMIKSTLQNAGIPAMRYTVNITQKHIHLNFTRIGFSNFVNWFTSMTSNKLYILKTCQVNATNKPGQVNVKLNLYQAT